MVRMPELPEVETVRRGLAARLEGRILTAVEQRRERLRLPLPDNFSGRLTGRRVTHLGRRGKYLLIAMDDDQVLIVHLGMSGRMFIQDAPFPAAAKHDHVLLTTDEPCRVTFNDARRFGFMALAPAARVESFPGIRNLGPEPLGNQFNERVLDERLAGKRTPIKSALLDQRIVAGLGNIYVAEALYRAGISPRRLAASVVGTRARRLVPAIREVLEAAIAAGGSTLKDYVQASGELGYFQHDFKVYDREGEACRNPDCGALVRRIVQAGRSTYYCPKCQR